MTLLWYAYPFQLKSSSSSSSRIRRLWLLLLFFLLMQIYHYIKLQYNYFQQQQDGRHTNADVFAVLPRRSFSPTNNNTTDDIRSTTTTTFSSSLLSVPGHQIQIQENEAFLWRGAQSRLCQHIKRERRKIRAASTSVSTAAAASTNNNHTNVLVNVSSLATDTADFDDAAKHEHVYPSRLQLLVVSRCQTYHELQQHGNYLLGYYAMKLAAIAHDADLVFRCIETEQQEQEQDNTHDKENNNGHNQSQSQHQQQDWLLWWLQSSTARDDDDLELYNNNNNNEHEHEQQQYCIVNDTLYDPPKPTIMMACQGMGRIPFQYVSEYARNDLRYMANNVLSLSFSASSTNSDTILMPRNNSDNAHAIANISNINNNNNNNNVKRKEQKIIIDDVAIHFRCGDILTKSLKNNNNYGLVKFDAYKKRIPTNNNLGSGSATIATIGIITAPFEDVHRRKQDRDDRSGEMCKIIVDTLRDYLQTHFPDTTITVRNDPNESIPIVLSRLIHAKYNFCVRSTFCLFPSIAAYGTSFVQKDGTAYFFEQISKVYNNIILMDEPFLLTNQIHNIGFNSTLEWLVS